MRVGARGGCARHSEEPLHHSHAWHSLRGLPRATATWVGGGRRLLVAFFLLYRKAHSSFPRVGGWAPFLRLVL